MVDDWPRIAQRRRQSVGHDLGVDAEGLADAAALLRRLLNEVEEGRLAADGPAAVALTRQLQGASCVLDLLVREDLRERPGAATGAE